jgi:death on curing protein
VILRRLSLDELVTINALVLEANRQSVGAAVKVGLLDSALQAPFAGFDTLDFYPQDWQKLGVLCSRIVLNHPFVDGNKRTALIAMLTLASLNNIDLQLPVSEETDAMILSLAARTTSEDDFCDWLRQFVEYSPTTT